MSRRPVGVVASLLCCVLAAACSAPAPRQAAPAPAPAPTDAPVSAERSPDALLAAVAAFHATADSGPLPAFGEPGFLEPPSDQELAWIADRSLPSMSRAARALELHSYSTAILGRYAATSPGGSASFRWTRGLLRLAGRIAPLLIDEILPTLSPSDPTYQARIDGLTQMTDAMVGMLQASLKIFAARHFEVAERRALGETWGDHIATYVRYWDQEQCAQLTQQLGEVAATETDRAIIESLRAVRLGLMHCSS